MTYQEAKDKADAYTDGSGKETIVYRLLSGFAWCTAWQYHKGNMRHINPAQVVYNTFEGEYDD
jgi:hypothetical protein